MNTEADCDGLSRALPGHVEGLRVAYLFGSVARSRQGPLSDLDLALLLDARHPARHDLLCRGQLQLDLERTWGAGRLDLVILNDAPLPLRYSVVSDGRLLFAADPADEQRFRLQTLRMYFDLMPLLEFHRRRLKLRLSQAPGRG